MLALIERIRQEYLALPGLKLTVAQARRLWPARDGVFTAAMDTLVAEGFLGYLPSGFYIAAPRPDRTAAKAELALRSKDQSMRCPHCDQLDAVTREQTLTGLSPTVQCIACGRIVTVSATTAERRSANTKDTRLNTLSVVFSVSFVFLVMRRS